MELASIRLRLRECLLQKPSAVHLKVLRTVRPTLLDLCSSSTNRLEQVQLLMRVCDGRALHMRKEREFVLASTMRR
jgi:hypothetical protein